MKRPSGTGVEMISQSEWSDRRRRRSPKRACALLVAVAAMMLCPRASVSAATDWWNTQWKVRRPITLKGAKRSAHAPLVAYVQFRDFGQMNRDGSDVRVVNEKGNEVPYRVMFYHPRLYCVVAFEPETPVWRGFVYYGNPNAPKVESRWEPRAGLFLTTCRRKGDRCDNWREMQEMIRLSLNEPDGAGFRPSIFDGHNPFGSSTDFVSVYDGAFYAPRTGTYHFATISDNASFVFIDAKMVTAWPGQHGVYGGERGEHSGPIALTAGSHRVQYYHVQFGDMTVAELAWRLPGEERPAVVEPKDYLAAFEASVDLAELRDDPARLEFAATPQATLEYGGHHYILWRFGNLSGTPGSPAATSQWDFGNGLISDERNPFAWFFRPGDYKVALRTTVGGGQARTVEQWIRVADLVQLDAGEQPDSFDRAAQMMAQYPIAALSADDRRAIVALLGYRGQHDAVERICREWIDDAARKNQPVPVEAVLELGRVLTAVRRKYADAEAAYEQALRRLRPDDELGCQVCLALGELRVRHLKKYDEAIAVLENAGKTVKPGNTVYRCRIAIATGDAYRAKLQRDPALRQYKLAEQLREASRTDAAQRSSFPLMVEAFLERDDKQAAAEKLDQWADRFPTDKLGGYWSLLRGRCLIRQGRDPEAVEEMALSVRLDPYSNYARDSYEQLGRAYDRLQQYGQAVQALRSAAALWDDAAKKEVLQQEIAKIERKAGARR